MNRLLMLILLLFPAMAAAQIDDPVAAPSEEAVTPAEPPKPKVDPKLELLLATPRKCYESFVLAVEAGNWSDATECMDFSDFVSPKEAKISSGEQLAYRLRQILAGVRFDALLPDAPEFEGKCLFSDYATDLQTNNALEGTLKNDFDRIAISRTESDGLWRFDAGTVKQIEEIYERQQPALAETLPADAGPKPFAELLRDQFHPALHNVHFLLPDYMWICLAVVAVLGFLADALVGILAIKLSRSWFGVDATPQNEKAIRRLWKPLGLLVQGVVWYYLTSRIGIPTWITAYLPIALRFFAAVAAVWLVFRLIDVASGYLGRRAEATSSRFDDLLIPLVSKSLKAIAVLVGFLIIADRFDMRPTALLGGLGLGGMALALASKDAVSNLFGSFTVLIDRPFEIGDWVITEDVEGTVEQVGFRSTRIRTFYNSLITLPNSRLTTAVVDNMGRRRYRRIKTTIGVQYDTTPEQLDAFCEGIRELIRRSPATRKDYFHVYFDGFGDSSLNVLIYLFLRVPDWSSELRDRHRLFMDILRLAQELKVEFAFPTRTLHMHPATARPEPHALPHDDPELVGREFAATVMQQTQSPGRSQLS